MNAHIKYGTSTVKAYLSLICVFVFWAVLNEGSANMRVQLDEEVVTNRTSSSATNALRGPRASRPTTQNTSTIESDRTAAIEISRRLMYRLRTIIGEPFILPETSDALYYPGLEESSVCLTLKREENGHRISNEVLYAYVIFASPNQRVKRVIVRKVVGKNEESAGSIDSAQALILKNCITESFAKSIAQAEIFKLGSVGGMSTNELNMLCAYLTYNDTVVVYAWWGDEEPWRRNTPILSYLKVLLNSRNGQFKYIISPAD